MNHHDGDMTDVFVVLEELDDAQTLEIAGILEGMGMIVRKIDNDESVIEGSIADGFAPASARDLYETVVGVPALLERLAALHPAPGGATARL